MLLDRYLLKNAAVRTWLSYEIYKQASTEAKVDSVCTRRVRYYRCSRAVPMSVGVHMARMSVGLHTGVCQSAYTRGVQCTPVGVHTGCTSVGVHTGCTPVGVHTGVTYCTDPFFTKQMMVRRQAPMAAPSSAPIITASRMPATGTSCHHRRHTD